jgi:hypothetical protein
LDFEIIVGNDYPAVPITPDVLGIYDSRIKLINYPQNIGPIRNANELLSLSEGHYFTWLADDDMYFPGFFKAINNTIKRFNFPNCIFTSYLHGETYPDSIKEDDGICLVYDGAEFLRQYLSRRINAIGCYGMYKIDHLRKIGGMVHLGNGYFSPYSDNLLSIRAGLLEKVYFIDVPLVFFRTHVTSVSYVSPDVAVYLSAQKQFLAESIKVFQGTRLKKDFNDNLFLLLKWCVDDFYSVTLRSGSIQIGKQARYVMSILPYIIKAGQFRCQIFLAILRQLLITCRVLLHRHYKKDILS